MFSAELISLSLKLLLVSSCYFLLMLLQCYIPSCQIAGTDRLHKYGLAILYAEHGCKGCKVEMGGYVGQFVASSVLQRKGVCDTKGSSCSSWIKQMESDVTIWN